MRKALIVGFDNYPSAPLSGCINDAKKISSILEKNGDGSPNFAIKLITDEKTIISKAQLREAIETLFKGYSDVVLLYFSGHGLIKTTGGVIVTPDYVKCDEGIRMDEILSVANQSTARDKIVILDCCHSGVFGSLSFSGSNIAQLGEGLTVLTASGDSESALEINGSGVFTSLLIDALQGGASALEVIFPLVAYILILMKH